MLVWKKTVVALFEGRPLSMRSIKRLRKTLKNLSGPTRSLSIFEWLRIMKKMATDCLTVGLTTEHWRVAS